MYVLAIGIYFFELSNIPKTNLFNFLGGKIVGIAILIQK